MELKEVFLKLKAQWKIILTVTVVGVALGFVYWFTRPKPIYQATALVFVNVPLSITSEDSYKYDGFYAQQTAFHYTDSIMAIAVEMGKKGFPEFKVIRKAEQVFAIESAGYINKPEDMGLETAKQSLQAFFGDFQKTVSSLNASQQAKLSVELINNEVEATDITPGIWLYLLVGGLTGMAAGVLVVGGKEYLS